MMNFCMTLPQNDVLSAILPEYIYTIVYGVLLESTASETGARMTAMKSASDNAEDMIKELGLMYQGQDSSKSRWR